MSQIFIGQINKHKTLSISSMAKKLSKLIDSQHSVFLAKSINHSMIIPLTVFNCFFPLYPNSVRYVNPYSLIRRYDKNRIINNSTPILPNRTTFSQSSFTVFGCVPSFSPKFMLKGYFGNITNVAANNITVSSSIVSSVKN